MIPFPFPGWFFYMYMYVQKGKRAKQSTFRMWMDMLISPKSSL